MRLRISILFLFLSAVACNLGAGASTPQPLATATPLSGGISRPVISITSPQNGAQVPVNQLLQVNVSASSSSGVTRVQLFVNGSPVATKSSINVNGDPQLNTSLEFTPRASGVVNLRVLAYSGTGANSISSEPADLQITVGNASTPTPIPNPNNNNNGGGNVVIPPDGVCRALTIQGPNLRTAPTTTQQNIITTLPPSTLAPILARLADSSWVKVNVNGRIGWVSAQFVSLSGNCFNIPVENPLVTPTAVIIPTSTTAPTITPNVPTNTPVPQLSDLIVTNIFDASNVSLGGSSSVTRTYSVTITNQGMGRAGSFNVTLRVNNGTAIDLGVVGGLERGQSVVLQTDVTFTATGTYNLRADVDPTNLVTEVSEVNNRGDITVTVTN
jgi:uncharacterized protein YraI